MSTTTGRLATGLLVAALALPLAACGDEEPSATPESDAIYLPSETPTATVQMTESPADYSTIEGEGYTIGAPSEFRQERFTSSNGEPALMLERPSRVEAVPQRVVVIRDVAPESSAAQQSYALENAKAAGGPEGEVTRAEMPAPEGEAAFLVTWKENRPSKGADNVQVTYWQLMHQTDDDLILNVVAFAPSDEFETSEVSTILRTFRVDGAG